MNMSSSDGQSRDVREVLTPMEAVTPEHLVRAAHFPVYGLIGHPNGLALKGLGYCSAPAQVNQPHELWRMDQPHMLLQVALDYDYLPPHQLTGRSIELVTTDIKRWPTDPEPDDPDPAQVTCYQSPHDVPLESAETTDFIVERFPIANETVEATIHRLPGSAWSFTLRNPTMLVEGSANGWPQNEFLSVLGQVAVVSNRPDVLAQGQRELAAWRHHINASIAPGRHAHRAPPAG